MKPKNVFLFLTTLLLAVSAFAGREGGGGNVGGSTQGEVLKVLDALDHHTIYNFLPSDPMAWFSILFHSRNIAASGNKQIDTLLDKMFEKTGSDFSSTAINKDWANTRRTYVNAPCLVNGKGQDGSVESNRLGSPVCISMLRLQRLPKSSLSREIIGLIAHEFSHHFGADEKLAKDFQRYFMDKVERLVRYTYASHRLTNDLGIYEQMNRTLYFAQQTTKLSKACSFYGQLSSQFYDAMISSDVIEYSDMNDIAHIGTRYVDSLFGTRDIVSKLIEYCEKDTWTSADRNAISKLVDQIHVGVKTTKSLLPLVPLP